MQRSHWIPLVAGLCFVLQAGGSRADQRVLIIGIDGAGGGYTQTASTPNLDALAADGGVRYDWLNEGALVPNPPDAYGASGVNWTTINTGVSAASHGVSDNSFAGNNLEEYPHWFKSLKQHDPTLYTASISHWEPINTYVVPDEYADLEIGGISDSEVRDDTVDLLTHGDPDAVFLHFDEVDGAGHSYGWGSETYLNQITTTDGYVGDIMAALNARPGVVAGTEDWLVMVTADHGGEGHSHYASQGLINWEVPFIISGPSVTDGVALEQGTLRDLAPTALWHMGIDPYGTTTEGDVVGLPYVFGSPNGIVGDVNQDGVVGGDGTGPAATDDVTAFIRGWKTSGYDTVCDGYTHGDLNLDKQVDLADWIVLRRLDPAMAAAAMAGITAVPEPASVMLLLLATTLAASLRTRR